MKSMNMKRENLRFFFFVGLFFVLAGLLLSSQHLIQYFQNRNSQPLFAQSIHQVTASKQATVSGMPTHIDLPAVNISIEVEPGYYNKASQTWSLSTTKAEYATITPRPNDAGGNTFIYGHNRPEVFYKLLQAKSGDEAIITTANNHKFVYKMVSRHDVKPTDSSLFDYQGPPILTLQTCSGFWYQNRSLFVFKLAQVV